MQYSIVHSIDTSFTSAQGVTVVTGNIWAHLLPLLFGIVVVVVSTASGWPHAGSLLFSLLLPVLLCLTGSVIYHTFMANHWNYKTYITLDVSHACCSASLLVSCDL